MPLGTTVGGDDDDGAGVTGGSSNGSCWGAVDIGAVTATSAPVGAFSVRVTGRGVAEARLTASAMPRGAWCSGAGGSTSGSRSSPGSSGSANATSVARSSWPWWLASVSPVSTSDGTAMPRSVTPLRLSSGMPRPRSGEVKSPSPGPVVRTGAGPCSVYSCSMIGRRGGAAARCGSVSASITGGGGGEAAGTAARCRSVSASITRGARTPMSVACSSRRRRALSPGRGGAPAGSVGAAGMIGAAGAVIVAVTRGGGAAIGGPGRRAASGIGSGAGSTVGADSMLGAGSTLGAGSMLGAGSTLGGASTIVSGTSIGALTGRCITGVRTVGIVGGGGSRVATVGRGA